MQPMMEVAGINNDLRGWIMCIVSGIACVVGASLICIDIPIRLLPGQKNFRIQDSSTFQACSLSLSFGVMLFMSLYSMLPEAKQYFKKGGIRDQLAGFILMACFVGGFFGIQILSRVFHQLLPSHVVDCDHSHDESAVDPHSHSIGRSRRQSRARSAVPRDRDHDSGQIASNGFAIKPSQPQQTGDASEYTPLLPTTEGPSTRRRGATLRRADTAGAPGKHGSSSSASPRATRSCAATTDRRPSMMQVQKRVMSFFKDTKSNCDEAGPCFGYTDPCGQECFKHVTSRSAFPSRTPTFLRTSTGYADSGIQPVTGEGVDDAVSSPMFSPKRHLSRVPSHGTEGGVECNHSLNHAAENGIAAEAEEDEDLEAQHHHHVASNAFMSLGLQTSIAIALHKFPEGFITYATNHANPALGFSVFLALFVHNISEGFALALPLYMALDSRLRAISWSFLLGGLSQPIGAAIAVLWFKVAKHTHMNPDAVAYGCLFAVTAGIMVSVSLQLFVESLSLNHNQNLSILFAFLGMTILGLSSAFTSEVH